MKLFDVISGLVVRRFEAHTDAVLCVRFVRLLGHLCLATGSEDGSIIKWPLAHDYRRVAGALGQQSVARGCGSSGRSGPCTSLPGEPTRMADRTTSMVYDAVSVPHCAGKYLLGACDTTLRIYDFEAGALVPTDFGALYTSSCDGVELVEPHVLPAADGACYVITRGCEVLDAEHGTARASRPLREHRPRARRMLMHALGPDRVAASRRNVCMLHRLTMPASADGPWRLRTVRRFAHREYRSNSWLVHLCTMGRYLFAPTADGRVLVWCIVSGACVALLHDHADTEVRQALYHPTLRLLLTCSDGWRASGGHGAHRRQPAGDSRTLPAPQTRP